MNMFTIQLCGAFRNFQKKDKVTTTNLSKFHSLILFLTGAYTQQFLVVRLPLSSFDRIPETFYDYVHVEYTMPSTTVSHTTIRSISVGNTTSEMPPEKFVRHNAHYEYKIGLNITYDDTKPEPEYVAAVVSSTSGNNGSVKSSAAVSSPVPDADEGGEDEDEDVRWNRLKIRAPSTLSCVTTFSNLRIRVTLRDSSIVSITFPCWNTLNNTNYYAYPRPKQ